MHNLTGKWKSVYNQKLSIGSDNGEYSIIQDGNKIFIFGSRSGTWGFKNFGYGELKENSDEFIVTWADTFDSARQDEFSKEHKFVYKIKIYDNDTKTETIDMIQGEKLSFGNWQKITSSLTND